MAVMFSVLELPELRPLKKFSDALLLARPGVERDTQLLNRALHTYPFLLVFDNEVVLHREIK